MLNKDNKNIDKSRKRAYGSDEESEVLDIDEASIEAVSKLKSKLKKCLEERKEFLDGWQRSKAELINARKQDALQNKKAQLRIREDLVYQLLPVLDSFDMAFSDTEKMEKVDDNWKVGIQNIHSQLKDLLRSVGVTTIENVGEPFDPSRHDPIETVAAKKKAEDGSVREILQKGYILNDSVIRAARVRVAEFKE